jgi:septum site-determining protein MinC
MPLTTDGQSAPGIRVRGRRFMALVVAPELPLADWFRALDAQLREVPALFADLPVVVDLSAAAAEGRDAILVVLEALQARDLRLAGVEGVDPDVLAGSYWARLSTGLRGSETAEPLRAGAATHNPISPLAPSPPSLLIDRPVRSGQSIVFEEGDVTVVGAVASGAEVVAGGSVHIYGALRGRAIAGLKFGAESRIFCRQLEAEMVGIDRLYRTAEHWGEPLHGRAVQVRCDRGALRLTAFD